MIFQKNDPRRRYGACRGRAGPLAGKSHPVIYCKKGGAGYK